MCGIAGVFDPASGGDVLSAITESMTATLRHRGPDSGGLWSDPEGHVAFGHRRLAVVDLSPAGHQPMTSRDGRYVLVFNGEIYNHRELRAKLCADGAVFRGHSDTEVLCEAISHWPLRDVLDRLNGMFAFAVWDKANRALTLARDRLGEKPLYYGWFGESFAFASELKALREHPQFDRRLDRRALAEYLRRTFIAAPLTIYAGIQKLLPGCWLTVNESVSSAALPEPEPYWSLADAVRRGSASKLRASELNVAVDEAERLLRDSVALRTESDVPLGAFLSGGIDSSLVVALLQAGAKQPVQTFTVSVPDEHLNEADAARAVATHLGTEHRQIDLTSADALAIVPRLAQVYDEPFADPSQIPTMLMCSVARRHVTVCLSGDGGDELFAGYNRYVYGAAAWSRARHVPAGVRSLVGRALLGRSPAQWDRTAAAFGRVLPQLREYAPGTKLHKLASLLRARDEADVYSELVTCWDPALLMSDADEHSLPLIASDLPLSNHVDRMLYFDGLTALPDDMLVKVDRASMASSLECRVPLLDHRLMEFVWRLPPEAKIRAGRGKWLLRQVLERYVPRELTDRPKLGFDPPIAAWLRGPLREWAGDLLAPERIRRQGLLDPTPIQHAWREHQSGERNHDYALWTLLMLEAWLDAEQAHQCTDADC